MWLKWSSLLIKNLHDYVNKDSKFANNNVIKPRTVFSIGVDQNKNPPMNLCKHVY